MDLALAALLNQLGRGAVDPLTDLVCRLPFLIGLWLVLVVAALRLDKANGRRVAASAALALALHFLVSEGLLKHALLALYPMRVRPYLAYPAEIVPIGERFLDSSFPSSHAASTAALATVFGIHYPRARPLCAAFALLMAFARVHDGMHYPTDVLAGLALGVGYGALAVRVVSRLAARLSARRAGVED